VKQKNELASDCSAAVSETEMFELVPKVRHRQCSVLETDRKSVPSRRSSM